MIYYLFFHIGLEEFLKLCGFGLDKIKFDIWNNINPGCKVLINISDMTSTQRLTDRQ